MNSNTLHAEPPLPSAAGYDEPLRLALDLRRALERVSDGNYKARLALALSDSLVGELASLAKGRVR